MTPCEHKHHGHSAVRLGLTLGALVVCATCGIHLCGDELAAMAELIRLLPQVEAALRYARSLRARPAGPTAASSSPEAS